MSLSYQLLLHHQPYSSPLVFVVSPELKRFNSKSLPHVFGGNTLCLHTLTAREIAAEVFADTLVPWAAEWLFHYECWAETGKWHGGGIHPSPSRSNSSGRPQASSVKERLIEAGRTAFGSGVDVCTLLTNYA